MAERILLRVVIPNNDDLEEILSFRGGDGTIDDGSDHEAAEQALFESLSESDVDSLARTSYAFWAWDRLHDNPSSGDHKFKSEWRTKSALREIQRFRIAENYDDKKCLSRIKTAVKWRQDEQIDLLRLCFGATVAEAAVAVENEDNRWTIIDVEVSEDEQRKVQHFESLILAELHIQKMVVRGCDRQNRAIVIKLSRMGPWPSDNADAAHGYEVAHCYFAERGIATSEYLTRGHLPEVMVVADFGDYDSSNSPPVGVMIAGLIGLQPHYPERLGKAVLLDAPMWLHGIVTALRPLLSETTRSRLIVSGGTLDKLASYFYSSSKSITTIMEELVDASQAMPCMLPGGRLSSEIDPVLQVTTVPFFCLYDQGR